MPFKIYQQLKSGMYGKGVVDSDDVDVRKDASTLSLTDVLKGRYLTSIPVDSSSLIIPEDGANYYLGSVPGLGLSMETPVMELGTTIRFKANDRFDIYIPDSSVEIANDTELVCAQGITYLLTLLAVCDDGGSMVNFVSLTELN